MIDEKKLIEKLEKMAKESREESGLKEPALLQRIIKEVKDMAVNEEIRQRIEREDVSDRWIPTTEGIPDDEYEVDVTVEHDGKRFVDTDRYDMDFENWESFSNENVVAWKPRPEPYAGETEWTKENKN